MGGSLGARAVELNVTGSNDGARRFYEEHGFVDTGERQPLREGSELLVVVMRRPLRTR
jgi:ribosomal protein S18 acetylase RimI-like enzyme